MSDIKTDRASADQGQFFFAAFAVSGGGVVKHPVFIVGKDGDSNDLRDVIVCKCTSQPARSPYDISVSLKLPTIVRTNKLYTIGRNQLLFKISHTVDSSVITNILQFVENAIKIR